MPERLYTGKDANLCKSSKYVCESPQRYNLVGHSLLISEEERENFNMIFKNGQSIVIMVYLLETLIATLLTSRL